MILQVKKIVESVIESETAYVDCLDVLYQYGKALSSATRTNQVRDSKWSSSRELHTSSHPISRRGVIDVAAHLSGKCTFLVRPYFRGRTLTRSSSRSNSYSMFTETLGMVCAEIFRWVHFSNGAAHCCWSNITRRVRFLPLLSWFFDATRNYTVQIGAPMPPLETQNRSPKSRKTTNEAPDRRFRVHGKHAAS